jgi:hypothetical protein
VAGAMAQKFSGLSHWFRSLVSVQAASRGIRGKQQQQQLIANLSLSFSSSCRSYHSTCLLFKDKPNYAGEPAKKKKISKEIDEGDDSEPKISRKNRSESDIKSLEQERKERQEKKKKHRLEQKQKTETIKKKQETKKQKKPKNDSDSEESDFE